MRQKELTMIEKINEKLSNYNWLDFEISNGGMDKILLHGFLDEADEDVLCLQFENVEYIQCRTTFTYEGKGPFIELIEGEEAKQINMDYWITVGKKVFRLSNTNIQGPMYIVADNVEMIEKDELHG